MCGIVGVASNGPMTHQMKEFFQSLLFHDVVRGAHATGVAAIDTLDRSLVVEKKAVPAVDFLSEKEINDNLFAVKHNFNIYIGHNRYATSGAKDDDNNAHPFIHGDIVGVHNGSLRNQSLLDDSHKFIVDSDNLFHQLNKTGLTDTLSKADGAFALVWYDKKDNTLNFIRNDERPLCVAKLDNGCWVWASERGMLTWLVNRHKSLKFATEESAEDPKVKTPMVYNLERGLHMAVPYKDKARQMESKLSIRKMVLPSFPVTSWANYGDNYSSRYSTRGGYRQDYKQGERSTFQKERDEVIGKHLLGGNCDARLEVIFLGHIRPLTKTGYQQNISVYQHRNVWGQEILLHAYNHVGNITSQWSEADIGKVLYVKIMNMTKPEFSTEGLTNEVLDGYAVSVNDISLSKPNGSFYGYTESGDEIQVEKSEADKIVICLEKKEDANGNVLPFPESDASKTSSSEEEASGKTMDDAVHIANDILSRTRFVEYMNINGYHCADCGKSLRSVPLSSAHCLEHFDREDAKTNVYMTCSRACHDSISDWVDELDSEYDIVIGNISND